VGVVGGPESRVDVAANIGPPRRGMVNHDRELHVTWAIAHALISL